jgi:hypothetical protein
MEPTDMKFAVRPWNLHLALAVAVITTIAYVLHDLVFQLTDNPHEHTIKFFLTVAGLLCIWASSGSSSLAVSIEFV